MCVQVVGGSLDHPPPLPLKPESKKNNKKTETILDNKVTIVEQTRNQSLLLLIKNDKSLMKNA